MQAGPEASPSRHDASRLDAAVVLYRHMVTLRLLSARMVDLQRTSGIASHASCLGEEAVIVAAALAAREGDWVFPGAREWGAAIVRGLPLETYVQHAFGSGADPAKGHSAPDHPPARKYRVAPASGVAGAHVPQAVGAAWAAKIKKEDVAAVALFGDAANGSGDLHNALNFAGVFKPACVFVCRVDGRVPRTAHDRAVAYGLASARVDGSDALDVLAVVRAALARAVSGQGATLIEAETHPLTPTLADDVWKRGGAELLALGDADPLVVLRRVLEREKLLDPAADEAIAREVRVAIDAAVVAAEQTAPPARATIFEDVYAKVPAHLEAQRAQKEPLTWGR
ncbi:MAG TPA: thiamine pyrophosphate-dependent enzyme [Labilithrix sp.]|nr:thiamine pyrophosphate-dependent enzyme [Labilithrix sp.]